MGEFNTEKKLKVYISDNRSNYHHSQEVWSEDYPKVSYSVYDMCERPEDAIIDRGLFSGYEYIDAVRLGIELAKQGYSDIKIVEYE